MTGTQYIKLYSKKISYEFELIRKISILRGDSGTGKTTLVQSIARAITVPSYRNESSAPLISIEHSTLNNTIGIIKNNSDSIIVLDETVQGLLSHQLADAINESNNYYLIITRTDLESIPYSYDSIYEITMYKNIHKLRRVTKRLPITLSYNHITV